MQTPLKIKLNKDFYDPDAIQEALDKFADICSGTILNKDIEVVLYNEHGVPMIKEEFCNYVIGLMKNKLTV